jgi:hypothetical protein
MGGIDSADSFSGGGAGVAGGVADCGLTSTDFTFSVAQQNRDHGLAGTPPPRVSPLSGSAAARGAYGSGSPTGQEAFVTA